ncbi:MAG: EamA family transporter [Chloroflexi bacterium]|nr:EamA family transporter [Chloroflexota bacterium]
MTTDRIGRTTTRRGLIFVVLAAALWGTSGVATKTIYTLVDISPVSVAAFRLALGAPMLLAAFRYTSGSRSFRIARADFAWMLLVGASLGMSQACYFAAISRVGVAVATLVTICTAPVLVCLFSAALLRERLTGAVGGALACALIGTVLLIGVGQRDAGPQVSASLGGILLALGAAFSFSVFILVSRLLANRYHPLLSITVAVSVGAALLLTVVAITIGVTVRYSWAVWALFLYLGLVPTALGYALFYRGVQNTTASKASIASLVEPLTSTGLALVIFGEQLGSLGLLGAALLISAIVFLYRNGSSRSE